MFKFLIITLWGVSIAIIAWYCLSVTREITYVTLADGRRTERKLPFLFKALLPFAGNLEGFVKRKFPKAVGRASARLVTAGFEGLLTGWEFIAMRFLVPICFGILWTFLVWLLGAVEESVRQNLPFFSLIGIICLVLQPSLWLSQEIKRRQAKILRGMPFMIDLLTLSVEAGVDFMNALSRSLEKRKMDPLTEELLRVNHEIQLGTTRREALRNLARRVDIPDMRSFAFSLIEADELGVSIGAILRIQSDQIRQKRFDRAEKKANEAPVKMLGPLMIFIFPAVFIVLLGPILSSVAGNLL